VKTHFKINLPTVNKGKLTAVAMSAYTSKDQSSISCSSGIVSADPWSGYFLDPRPAVQWVAGTLHRVNRPLDFATHHHVFGGLGIYDSAPLTISARCLLNYIYAVHVVILFRHTGMCSYKSQSN
jgi:hypothetical protein